METVLEFYLAFLFFVVGGNIIWVAAGWCANVEMGWFIRRRVREEFEEYMNGLDRWRVLQITPNEFWTKCPIIFEVK